MWSWKEKLFLISILLLFVVLSGCAEEKKPETIIIEDTDPAVTWSKECEIQQNPGASGGSWIACPQEGKPPAIGAKIIVKFNGTAVSLIHVTCPHCGVAKVEIDGKSYPVIDMYSAETKTGVKTKIAEGLPNTQHTLILTVAEDKNPNSADHVIVFDAIEVTTS